jgi:hypothetical protein
MKKFLWIKWFLSSKPSQQYFVSNFLSSGRSFLNQSKFEGFKFCLNSLEFDSNQIATRYCVGWSHLSAAPSPLFSLLIGPLPRDSPTAQHRRDWVGAPVSPPFPTPHGIPSWTPLLPFTFSLSTELKHAAQVTPSAAEPRRANGTLPSTLVTPVRWTLTTLRLPGACPVHHCCPSHRLHPASATGSMTAAASLRPP